MSDITPEVAPQVAPAAAPAPESPAAESAGFPAQVQAAFEAAVIDVGADTAKIVEHMSVHLLRKVVKVERVNEATRVTFTEPDDSVLIPIYIQLPDQPAKPEPQKKTETAAESQPQKKPEPPKQPQQQKKDKTVQSQPNKPQQKGPRPPKAAPAKPAKKTTAERKVEWKEKIKSTGEFTDPKFIDMLVDYASENHGYDRKHKAGGVLISMFKRLVQRCTDRLPTFSSNDAHHAFQRLVQFKGAVKETFGENANQWRMGFAKFTSVEERNAAMRDAIDEYFHTNGPLSKIPPSDHVLLQFRDAAWPAKWEVELEVGGSYLERYIYLIQSYIEIYTDVCAMLGNIDPMFVTAYHTKPTQIYLDRKAERHQRYLEKHGGADRGGERRSPSGSRFRGPSWVKDGKCTKCGSPVTQDSDGNYICTSVTCSHNIPAVYYVEPKDGEEAPSPSLHDALYAPRTSKGERDKGGKRDGRDHRHGSNDDEFERSRSNKKHRGPRVHIREDDDDVPAGEIQGGGERTVLQTPGGENLGSLGGLFDKVQIAPAPADAPKA